MNKDHDDITTAVDYLQQQNDLEQEARRLMPFDPNECTYDQGELRQAVFACLTCSRTNNNQPVGVCYSCSIQCHGAHDLVELFSKRGFVCDCGTTRMAQSENGGCKLRIQSSLNSRPPEFKPRTGSSSAAPSWRSRLELPPEDVPGSNSYNHNYQGLFCSCAKLYNPLEEEGTMFQCYFGFECGEDWFHDDCILGYNHGVLNNSVKTSKLANDDRETTVRHFPNLDDFDVFICWKCLLAFQAIFDQLETYSDIVLTALPHFNNVDSVDQWETLFSNWETLKLAGPPNKKIKLENNQSSTQLPPKSYFLKYGFKEHLLKLSQTTDKTLLKTFLANHNYLFLSDPIYEPPQDDDTQSTESGSLLDLGTEALQTLPRDQAVEGLQAYDKIRNKLREFFIPFAEQGKVVTEQEVRQFFDNVKKEQ